MALQKNSWWLHFKGGVYQFMGLAQDANFDWNSVYGLASPEEQAQAAVQGNRVLYRGEDGIIWDRPLAEFLGNNAAGQKRFLQISKDDEVLSPQDARLRANKLIAGLK